MLDKIKDLSSHVANKAGTAMEDLAASVKGGVGSLASTAGSLTETLNEKAVRASTSQMCSILEIAVQELKGHQLAARPVVLTASVAVGFVALQMQVHVDPSASTEIIVAPDAVPPT